MASRRRELSSSRVSRLGTLQGRGPHTGGRKDRLVGHLAPDVLESRDSNVRTDKAPPAADSSQISRL